MELAVATHIAVFITVALGGGFAEVDSGAMEFAVASSVAVFITVGLGGGFAEASVADGASDSAIATLKSTAVLFSALSSSFFFCSTSICLFLQLLSTIFLNSLP